MRPPNEVCLDGGGGGWEDEGYLLGYPKNLEVACCLPSFSGYPVHPIFFRSQNFEKKVRKGNTLP